MSSATGICTTAQPPSSPHQRRFASSARTRSTGVSSERARSTRFVTPRRSASMSTRLAAFSTYRSTTTSSSSVPATSSRRSDSPRPSYADCSTSSTLRDLTTRRAAVRAARGSRPSIGSPSCSSTGKPRATRPARNGPPSTRSSSTPIGSGRSTPDRSASPASSTTAGARPERSSWSRRHSCHLSLGRCSPAIIVALRLFAITITLRERSRGSQSDRCNSSSGVIAYVV